MKTGALITALMLMSLSVANAASDKVVDTCFDVNADKTSEDILGACSELIESREFTGRSLSDIYLNRGLAYQDLAQDELAIKDFDNALTLYPRSQDALDYRGLSYLLLEQADKAIADFNRSI